MAYFKCKQLLQSMAHSKSLRPWICQLGVVTGDRSFAAVGPRVWKNLPSQLRHMSSATDKSNKLLKTFSDRINWPWIINDCLFAPEKILLLTYLLTYLLFVRLYRKETCL